MDTDQRAAYDATRDFRAKGFRAGCYAPFTSMYLDPAGDVRACCQNVEHVLGNVGEASLSDIWRGAKAEDLRRAMVDYDMGLGCRFCQWQFDDGNFGRALAVDFDELDVAATESWWPQRLELAISNTCNLECVMCDGDLSSRIRRRREHRPPLPVVYDDRFFEDLVQFLPHLVEVRFLGGEPFLARETFRVWDLMAEADLRTPCKVTTNGTQWNDKVERVLDRFPVSVAISLDGVTRETIEAIRVGASYDELMANLDRFRTYTRDRGTELELTYCLMRANWREFGDYLLFADSWGCRVGVNTVIREPFSLYQLPLPEFEEVVAQLERRDRRLRRKLRRNRDVWCAELDRLRHWRDQSRRLLGGVDGSSGVDRRATYFQPVAAPTRAAAVTLTDSPSTVGPPTSAPPVPDIVDTTPAVDETISSRIEPLPPILTTRRAAKGGSLATAAALAIDGMGTTAATHLECDADDLVIDVGPDGDFAGVDGAELRGLPYEDAVGLVWAQLGRPELLLEELVDAGVIRHVHFHAASGDDTYVRAVAFPVPGRDEPAGRPGSITVVALSRVAPAWATRLR